MPASWQHGNARGAFRGHCFCFILFDRPSCPLVSTPVRTSHVRRRKYTFQEHHPLDLDAFTQKAPPPRLSPGPGGSPPARLATAAQELDVARCLPSLLPRSLLSEVFKPSIDPPNKAD